jgi:hypothetical protein
LRKNPEIVFFLMAQSLSRPDCHIKRSPHGPKPARRMVLAANASFHRRSCGQPEKKPQFH